MKVVLTRDVKDMGRAHEVVEVSDGHAINFLIPKRFAVAATPTNMKSAESRVKVVADRKALDVKLVEDRLQALAEEKVVIRKKANEQGHLFDSVDATEIAAVSNVPEDAIRIEKPFKEIGEHTVPVSFGTSMGKFTIVIEAE